MKELRRFKYALEGIFTAVKTESHFRFHLVAAFYVFLFAYLGDFSITEWCVLLITVGSVLALELVNTALESLCDLYSKEQNPLIKRIKDIAAGAVLIFAFCAAAVAVFLFLSTGKLQSGIMRIYQNPLWFIPLGLSAAGSVIFIIFLKKNKHK